MSAMSVPRVARAPRYAPSWGWSLRVDPSLDVQALCPKLKRCQPLNWHTARSERIGGGHLRWRQKKSKNEMKGTCAFQSFSLKCGSGRKEPKETK